MFVRDCMTKKPITILEKNTVFEALEVMKREKIRRLPVIRDEQLVGIVTELDLMRVSPSTATTLSVFEMNYLLSKMLVRDVMAKQIIFVSPDATIEEAAVIMRDNDIGGLPVLERGKLVGIVTETNLFDALLAHFGIRKGGVRVTFELEDKPGQLAAIADSIRDIGGNVVSLATSEPIHGVGKVVVRVTGVESQELVSELSARGLKISHIS